MSTPLVEQFILSQNALIAALLGTAIGMERQIRGKDPSLKTFAFICMGSCIFAMLSKSVPIETQLGDAGRIAAQIVTGVGFLGAGAIFRSPRGVTGLTTAAMMWVTAAIGMAVGFGEVSLGVVSTLYCLGLAFILNLLHEILRIARGAPAPKPPAHHPLPKEEI